MAAKNISFREAEKISNNPALFTSVLKSNRFAPLNTLNGSEYPPLPLPVHSTIGTIEPTNSVGTNRNLTPTAKRKKAVNSQSQRIPTGKIQRQNSPQLNTQVATPRNEVDYNKIRGTLIKAVGELLDRICNSSVQAENLNRDALQQQVDQIIFGAFNFDSTTNNLIHNAELNEDTTMEL